MPAAALTRALGLAAAASALAGCMHGSAPVSASDLPGRGLARLVGMKSVTFAWETAPACRLETATGDAMPSSTWQPLAMNALGGKTLDVADLRIQKRDGQGHVQAVALALREGPQSIRWVRNPPSDDEGAVASAWRCVTDPADKDHLAPHLAARARKVRLALDSAACSYLTPVLGGPDDLSILPFEVGDQALFAPAELPASAARDGSTNVFVGVRLSGADGHALTLRSDDLDRCFVAADDAAQDTAGDAPRVAQWLSQDAPDPAGAPDVPLAALRAATGVDLARCAHDGDGPAEHYECVVPSLRASMVSGSAVAGKPLQLVRERTVDAVHVYGGRVVPATDAVARDVAVNVRSDGSVAGAVAPLLEAAALDPKKQQARAALGWRLIRRKDVNAIVEPTDTLTLDVSYTVPAPATGSAQRKRTWVAGKKDVPNPAFYRNLRDYERVRDELSTVLRAPGAVAPDWHSVLERRLADAKARVEATPKQISVDDVQTFAWSGMVIRRSGVAKVKATLRATDGTTLLTTALDVPFEAVDMDDLADPAHGIAAKPAKAPSPADVDKVLAAAIVERADQLIAQALLKAHLGAAAPPSVQPGSRPWALAVARRAVSDRPLALVSDWVETRPDVLKSPILTVAFDLPPDSKDRCFVFTAVPVDPGGDANLVFGVPPAAGSKRFVAIGRDARPDRDAAFELCNVAPGHYAVGAWQGHDVDQPGILLSIFDSTPGAAHDDDLRAAASGAPSTATGTEPPTLTAAARR
jgi:hypothetical protein